MDNLFDNLYKLTKETFDKSDIRKYAIENGHVWNYAVMSTRVSVGAPLILGFNNGAEENFPYPPQLHLPPENFKELMDLNWLGSFSAVYNSLVKYLPFEDVDNFMMSNFCFFRSDYEEQITLRDLLLCKPLFEELLIILKPSKIIGFSAKLRDYIRNNKLYFEIDEEDFPSGKSTLFVSKGTMQIGDDIIPFYMLPHPNSQFTGEAREKAWKYCFPN